MLLSSSPQLRIPVFPFLFLAAAVVVQSLLYRRTIAWIDRNAGESSRAPLRRWAKIAFVVLNAPWLGMPVWWLGYDASPLPIVGTLLDVSVEYLAVPSAIFLIWQFSCVALVGLYVGSDVIALAWRRIAARVHLRSLENAAEAGSPEPPPESPLREPSAVIGRREFVQAASLALTASPFIVSGYGAYVARESFRVERVVLTYPGLPPELRGLTIVQLTDVHAGIFMDHRRMMEFVNAANRLDPDLTVLTGDFVANSSRYVPLFIGAFKHLRARCGVFATLGNHDLFTNSATPLLEALRRFNKGYSD